MRTNKNRSKIILALAVAFLATMISYSAFSNMHSQLKEQQKLISVMQQTKAGDENEQFAYAVSTADLKSGEIVADSDVDFKQFSEKNPNAFDNRSDVINKILLKDIKSGEVFTNAHIAKISNDDVSLKSGYRALTLPADNFQGKSDSMKTGSFVDIYSASGESSWVLEDVRILAFESIKTSSSNDKSSMTNASGITFEVSENDISDFISNISKGKLVLVARGANDKKIYHKKPKVSASKSYSAGSSYHSGSIPSLPDLPSSVPISNYSGGGGSSYSGLPQPIQPAVNQPSVELIEANVKSKVTFEAKE